MTPGATAASCWTHLLKDLSVDPRRRIARADPGRTLGDLDRGPPPHGLATPLGVVFMTAIAGLTFDGGLGYSNGECAWLVTATPTPSMDHRRVARGSRNRDNYRFPMPVGDGLSDTRL